MGLLAVALLIVWEIGVRPPESSPWKPEWDSRRVRDLIEVSPILFLGDSLVGALPKEFEIDPGKPDQTHVFNLESVLFRETHGVALRSLKLLEQMNIRNKIIFVEVDSYQWSSAGQYQADSDKNWDKVCNDVIAGKFRAYDANDPFRLWSFEELRRVQLLDVLDGLKNFRMSESFTKTLINWAYQTKWSIPVALMNLHLVDQNTVFEVAFPQMETTDSYFRFYPLLREFITRGLVTEEIVNKTLRPRIIQNLYAHLQSPASNNENLAYNLNILANYSEKLSKNGNRIVLVRLPRDEEPIRYENETFPIVGKTCADWKNGCLDLTRLNVFLFDGAHAHDRQVPIILDTFKKKALAIVSP